MQVFNAFLKVLKKKLPSALIYVLVFLAISIPMTKSGQSAEPTGIFEQTKVNICIFDEDHTPESQALTEHIGKKHNLIQLENDRDILIDALYYERADYVLVINQDYSEKLITGNTDGLFSSYHLHESYSMVLIENFLNEYVSSVRAYLTVGEDISSAVQSAENALSLETEVVYASFNNSGENTDFPVDFSFYFRYMPYIMISALMNVLCPILLTMNRKDIRFRTNCSCVKPNSYTMQIFAGSTVLIIAVWLVFMIAGIFLYGGIYHGRAWLAVLNSFIFALVSASIAVFISGFHPSQELINLMTQVIGLGMSFLCGIFVDQSILGDGVLAAARFFPAYWYVRANEMLAGKEIFDVSQLAVFLAIETAFAIVLALLSLLVRRLKYSETNFSKIQ